MAASAIIVGDIVFAYRTQHVHSDGMGFCGRFQRSGPIPNYSSRRSSVASGIFSIPTRLATSKRSSRYLCGVS